MNSRQEPVVTVRTRKALNSLQYSPNGKDLAGLSHNLKSNQTELSKKQVKFLLTVKWILIIYELLINVRYFLK
jgi:hypothetical protein